MNGIKLYGFLLFASSFVLSYPLLAAKAEDKLPSVWRKTMIEDPAQNYPLRKYAAPLASSVDSEGRNILLGIVLNQECEGARLNHATFDAYVRKGRTGRMSLAELKPVSDDVASFMNGFDYRDLAHLCAGINSMFGPSGSLVKGMLIKGKGEPKSAYDPANPYIRLSTLLDLRR